MDSTEAAWSTIDVLQLRARRADGLAMIDLRAAAGGEPVTEAEVNDTLIDVMERSGMHPAYVHAARTCGYIVTEANESRFTPAEVDRWDDAIDEWYDLHPEADADD